MTKEKETNEMAQFKRNKKPYIVLQINVFFACTHSLKNRK
jgi:hypothetical protein